MQKIAIVTDSAADLPLEYITQHNITVVPLEVTFADGTYKDGVDLTAKEFYTKLENESQLPTTSQATPLQFHTVFEELLKEHQQIIAIHVSSELSGTYNSALLAKDMLSNPERATVIDSQIASLGQGLLVLLAAEMATAGKDLATITEALKGRIATQFAIFTIDTLDNLVKGGRLSSAQGFVGSMLKVKPILWMSESTKGKIEPLDKVRGRKKALRQVLSHLKQQGSNFREQRIGVSHAEAEDIVEVLAQLRKEIEPKSIVVSKMGAAVGTHVGQGAVSFFFVGV